MAIEQTVGQVLQQVESFCKHLVATQGGFTATSNPSLSDIDVAITVTQAEILVWLSSFGYSSDTTGFSAIGKNFLARYNALGAAYQIELANTGMSSRGAPANRADHYYRLYMALYNGLKDGSLKLDVVGVPASSAATLSASATGISISDKAELEDDEDAVQPKFSKEMMRSPTVSTSGVEENL